MPPVKGLGDLIVAPTRVENWAPGPFVSGGAIIVDLLEKSPMTGVGVDRWHGSRQAGGERLVGDGKRGDGVRE